MGGDEGGAASEVLLKFQRELLSLDSRGLLGWTLLCSRLRCSISASSTGTSKTSPDLAAGGPVGGEPALSRSGTGGYCWSWGSWVHVLTL